MTPVVVVGGFLGSGKTSLVNYLLALNHERRLVVLVNDFGELDIDMDLVASVEADRVSLKNGCVCCTLNDDLVRTIADIVANDPSVDAFVIEASGVSDTRQLDSSIVALEAAGIARLDLSLYLIDADHFFDLDFDTREDIIDQASVADLVALNKMDLCEPEVLVELTDLMLECAPDASVHVTSYAQVPQEWLFGASARRDRSNAVPEQTHEKNSGHTDNFKSVSAIISQPFERAHFDRFCEALVGICIRAKGFVTVIDEKPRRYVFHLVGRRASLELIGADAEGVNDRIVLIAYQRHAEKLQPLLDACLSLDA